MRALFPLGFCSSFYHIPPPLANWRDPKPKSPIVLSHLPAGSLSLCPESPPRGKGPSLSFSFSEASCASTHAHPFSPQVPLTKYLLSLTFKKEQRGVLAGTKGRRWKARRSPGYPETLKLLGSIPSPSLQMTGLLRQLELVTATEGKKGKEFPKGTLQPIKREGKPVAFQPNLPWPAAWKSSLPMRACFWQCTTLCSRMIVYASWVSLGAPFSAPFLFSMFFLLLPKWVFLPNTTSFPRNWTVSDIIFVTPLMPKHTQMQWYIN